MKFQNTDPRHTIYKGRQIVIYRPTPPTGEPKVCLGFCETKHEYYVHTDFPKPYHRIGADKEWPEDWYWTYLELEGQE